jgi:hypothetical protein
MLAVQSEGIMKGFGISVAEDSFIAATDSTEATSDKELGLLFSPPVEA